jgi:hypothetical protein
MLLRPVFRNGATAVTGALMLGLIAAGGCKTGNDTANAAQERSTSAVKSMSDLKQEAWNGRLQVDETMATLNSLSTTDNLPASFQRFSQQVDQVNAESEKIKSLTSDMREHVHDYITQWDADMEKVNDPNLVALADQRRAAVQQRYGEIRANQQAFSDAYSVFYGDLTSLRSYLSNDLTAAAVKSAQPNVQKANEDRKTMKDKADKLLKTLHEVSAGIKTPQPD